MPDSYVEQVKTTQQVGDTHVVREQVSTSTDVNGATRTDHTIAKSNQIFWYIAHVIVVILTLRFIFLLLGANRVGIVQFIYEISGFFLIPIRGIFRTVQYGTSFFDASALVAIVLYYLLALLLTEAVALFSKRTE